MAASEWYKDWFNSPYYHKLYYERDEKEAIAFMERVLLYLKPPAHSRVVDIGCGRGRNSRFLSNQGLDVTGIDMSPDTITHAKQFETDQLRFYVHDMRLLFWVNYFDYAFNFFTSFGYFNTRREHEDCIRTIAGGLRPGGQVMLDYLNVHYTEDRLLPEEIKKIDTTQFDIKRWHDDTHFYKRIVVTDPKLPKPIDCTEKIAKLTLGDFNDMFSYHKLQVQDVFGDYCLNGYHVREAPRIILLAKKV